jgi:hypothetical protein
MFMEEFPNPNVEGRKKSEFRSPNLRARSEVSLRISGFLRASRDGRDDSLCPKGTNLNSPG